MESFIIIGGDKRQKELIKCLSSHSFRCRYLAKDEKCEEISEFTHVILPVPITKDGINIYCDDSTYNFKLCDIIGALNKNQVVIGGAMNGKLKDGLKEKEIGFYDVLDDENFAISNAYLTAQGCLRLLLESTQDYIPGSKALIIGFGRVAFALSLILKAIDVDVYIAARSTKQLEKAKYLGCKTIKLNSIEGSIYYFDYIFGTVPKTILTYDIIRQIRDDCIYFELASKPFTANRQDFISLGKKYAFGGSLPGKYLPTGSGKLLYEHIMQFISKQKE